MKISFILELLLILVLIAYAAQARIVNGNGRFCLSLIVYQILLYRNRETQV